MYQTSVTYNSDLKNRIQATVAMLNIGMLQRTWIELEYRLDFVCVTDWCRCPMCVLFRTNFESF